MTEDAIDFIEKDDRWAEVMIEILFDFVTKKLITQDTELTYKLAYCIMDRIYFAKKVPISELAHKITSDHQNLLHYICS